MDEWLDRERKLNDDLIEQFRGKPKIAAFNKAVARQLEGLRAFFRELRVLQWLGRAEGAQLDGIGNIVDLSRTDALIWASQAGQHVPMDDGAYRMYLWFKIFLNTSGATYGDVARTIAKFWPDVPFYYSEDKDAPATMFFTSAPMPLATDLRVLRVAARVKAAGVALRFVLRAEPDEAAVYHAHAAGALVETIALDNPELGAAQTDYPAAALNVFAEGIALCGTCMDGIIPARGGMAAGAIMETEAAE